MRWAVFGLVILGIAWVLIAGTDTFGRDVKRGILYSPPTAAPTSPGATPFRFVAPSRG